MASGKGKKAKKSTGTKQKAPGKGSGGKGRKVANRDLPENAVFPLVGIGASAGGLEALQRFFEALPADCGAGFVVVQHLDPKHESMLCQLLQQYTAMEVQEAADGMEVKAGHVYVLPPDKVGSLAGSNLVLEKREPHPGLYRPVDTFLQSLAAVRGRKAIAVILSGTGADGTIGLQEVKAAGGMVVAQDPDEAEQAGMPRSAIGTGLVDFILPAGEMGAELLRYTRHSSYGEEDSCGLAAVADEKARGILELLHRQLHYDFASYKQGTILRRIERRLAVRHVADLDGYRRLLEEDPQEIETLARELLITVTSFFRDPDVFKVLSDRIFPGICRKAGSDMPVRIWVPGAATGEEAYSLAMVCFEALEKLGKQRCQLRIFATDIDRSALECARTGIYPATIAADVSVERLGRFFDNYQDGYRIKKAVRQAMTFSVQNLIKDPPFAGLDLISCRNLLIYLTGETQRHILSLLHFALKPGGYLLLGSTEGVGKNSDLFQPIDQKMHLFRKKEAPRPHLSGLTGGLLRSGRGQSLRPMKGPVASVRKMAEKQLLKYFTPCSVVLNHRLEVLHYLGDTGLLQIPDGDPTTSLPAMLPTPCRNPVRSFLRRMIDSGERTASSVLGWHKSGDNGVGKMEVTVRRLLYRDRDEELYLVVLREQPQVLPLQAEGLKESSSCSAQEHMIRQLEEELQFSNLNLEDTIEQLEAANEELRASNEEAMAVNEEFLSTNEELEASREELQALNEELSTVNAQLEEQIASYEQSTGDFDNLLACGCVGAIFLDRKMRVKRLTPVIGTLFPQLPFTIGKMIEARDSAAAGVSLLEDARQVLDSLQPVEREIEAAGCWYLQRVLPYRLKDNRVGGVVITFTDVTEIKNMALKADRRTGFLQLVADALPVRMAYIDTQERIRYANELYYSWLGLSQEEVMGATLLEVLGRNAYKRIRPYIHQGLGGVRNRFETPLEYPGRGIRHVLAECAPHFDENGKVIGVFGVILDITDRKETERNNAWLAAIVQSSTFAIVSKDFDGTVRSWNKGAEQIYGFSAEEMIGNNIDQIYPEEAGEEMAAMVRKVRQGRQVQPFETMRLRKDRTVIYVLLTLSPILGDQGKPVAVSVLASDISSRKSAERELQELNRDLERKVSERTSALEQHMVQLRKVAMDLTQTEQRERERLSKILHDDMQQLLVAAGLRLERLEDKLKTKIQKEIVQQAADLLGQASTVARNIATDLRPPMLLGASLLEGLRWLVEWTWQRFDLAVHLEVADNFKSDAIPEDLAAYLIVVVRELLFNVVKHAQVKTARVKIGTDRQHGLVLRVEDQGIGSATRQIDELAESVKGMGLRSIRERLELMGGSFSIETSAGKGFRVAIFFPYPEEAGKRRNNGAGGGRDVRPPAAEARKIRVMLVDDHHLIREGLRMVLEDAKDLAVVAEAENGRKAVQAAAQCRPDVVVMDINMPEMDGIEATSQIKKLLPSACIIGLSVDGDSGRLQTMLDAGASAHLEKDGPTDQLLGMVRRCFREQQQKEEG